MNKKFMDLAIELAEKGKGQTAPNPCVGAVITKENKILGKGYHKKYGGPHAEVEAIDDALSKGHNLEGSTLWVTLEPCNHYGKTPPCTNAILRYKIKKVKIGTKDPNPNVCGGGAEYLRGNGVDVEIGICEDECRFLINDFITWNNKQRPYIYLKLAQTIDGKIASKSGDSKWISCEKSREMVHSLRERVDAILVGGNTFYKDNPKLTPRLTSKNKKDPYAIILTSNLPDPDANFYLLQKRPTKTIFFTTDTVSEEKIKRLQDRGVKIFPLYKTAQGVNIEDGFKWLFSELNVYYVLCEGGGKLANTLLNSNLVDELFLFVAPIVIGDDSAISSFSGNDIGKISDAKRLSVRGVKIVDRDVLIHLTP